MSAEVNALVTAHADLARKMAHKVANRHPDVVREDLISICLLALFDSAQKFDPTMRKHDGSPMLFGPYAVANVKWKIQAYLHDHIWGNRERRSLEDEVGISEDGDVETFFDRVEDRAGFESHQSFIAASRQGSFQHDLQEAMHLSDLTADESKVLRLLVIEHVPLEKAKKRFPRRHQFFRAYSGAIMKLRDHFASKGLKVASTPVKTIYAVTARGHKGISKAVTLRSHLRWHVARGIKNPKCHLCRVR